MKRLDDQRLIEELLSGVSSSYSKKQNKVPTNSEQGENLRHAFNVRGKFLKGRDLRNGQMNAKMEYLSRKSRNWLAACNPYSGEIWAKYLYEGLSRLGNTERVAALTLFHPEFDRAVPRTRQLKIPHHDFSDLKLQCETRVRSILRRWPFLMTLDLALHRFPRESAYRLLPHHHGIIFGNRAEIKKALGKFPQSGLAGAPIFKLAEIDDLLGWLNYISKDPRCMYVTVPPEKAGLGTFHHRERLFSAHQLYLLDLYGDFTKPELCIGSGIGAEIRREATRHAQKRGWRKFT